MQQYPWNKPQCFLPLSLSLPLFLRVRYMLLSPPLNNCVITQFSVITRLHRLARTNVVCNNSESITLLAERFPAAPSVEGREGGRFALNDIPPALRVAIVSKTESLACIFLLFFLLPLSLSPLLFIDKYCRFIFIRRNEKIKRGNL